MPRDASLTRSRLQRLGALRPLERVCARQGVTLEEMIQDDRHPHVVRCRHRCWLLLRHTLLLSYPEIADLWGADHTTVLSAVKKLEQDLQAEYAA